MSFIVDQEAVKTDMFGQLSRYDVEPILKQLARLLEMPPSEEALQKWSDNHPDRWAMAISTLARIGGFSEKRELAIGVTIDLGKLSDSQLQQQIKTEMARLAIVSDCIDVPFVELEPKSST